MTSTGTAESVTDRGWARVPTTTTSSSNPPTSITTLMEAVALALTSTTCAGAVKPKRVNVTSYIPGARPLNVNWPGPSVTVTCPLPAASRASTVTPGIHRNLLPVASVTVPEIVASWALATPGAYIDGAKTSTSGKPVCDCKVSIFDAPFVAPFGPFAKSRTPVSSGTGVLSSVSVYR